jgi:hypothetical protein
VCVCVCVFFFFLLIIFFFTSHLNQIFSIYSHLALAKKVDAVILKQFISGLSILLLEAAKNGVDSQTLK